jgi:hypothetical protein
MGRIRAVPVLSLFNIYIHTLHSHAPRGQNMTHFYGLHTSVMGRAYTSL